MEFISKEEVQGFYQINHFDGSSVINALKESLGFNWIIFRLGFLERFTFLLLCSRGLGRRGHEMNVVKEVFCLCGGTLDLEGLLGFGHYLIGFRRRGFVNVDYLVLKGGSLML